MEILNIVDKLEALITTSLKVPVAQRTLLDARKVQELMDQMRLAVPQDVTAAEEIVMRKEDIFNQAEVERRKIKAQAEEEFRARLNQTEVMNQATTKAHAIIQEAEHKASKLMAQADMESRTKRAEADAYSAKTLRAMEKQLTANLTSIRNGLALLSGVDTFEVVTAGMKR
ncbi:hypothetical protein FIM04_03530 [SAR202 cluster bacterium AC-409-J13_OGT_754m]|nr:hypothetical protein [SAR202 cluster bacterium AC-409-J13_OGT_754m]